jgi:hypothetical protein
MLGGARLAAILSETGGTYFGGAALSLYEGVEGIEGVEGTEGVEGA